MDSFEDNEFKCSKDSDEMNQATVLPREILGEVSKINGNVDKQPSSDLKHVVYDDSDHLYGSVNEEEYEKFTTYKSCEGVKFQLSMMFINKQVISGVTKDYAMESQKYVFIKKNTKKMEIHCMVGCKYYERFGKRVENQFLQNCEF